MLEFNFTPFPVLRTERLILRKLAMTDAPEIFIQRTEPTIQKFIKRIPPVNIEEAKQWMEKVLTHEENNETITWAIVPKEESRLIGTICLWNIEKEYSRGEVGYSLHPDYFGRGLMTEALQAACHYGFQTMKLQRIDAYTHKNNEASIRLLKKNKFERNLAFENEYPDKEELEYNTIYTLNRH